MLRVLGWRLQPMHLFVHDRGPVEALCCARPVLQRVLRVTVRFIREVYGPEVLPLGVSNYRVRFHVRRLQRYEVLVNVPCLTTDSIPHAHVSRSAGTRPFDR